MSRIVLQIRYEAHLRYVLTFWIGNCLKSHWSCELRLRVLQNRKNFRQNPANTPHRKITRMRKKPNSLHFVIKFQELGVESKICQAIQGVV